MTIPNLLGRLTLAQADWGIRCTAPNAKQVNPASPPYQILGAGLSFPPFPGDLRSLNAQGETADHHLSCIEQCSRKKE
jgi:hypothetical protein